MNYSLSIDDLKDLNRDRLLDEVAIQLHSAMVTRGISKGELARKLGIKPPSITKMLGGRNNFRLETLADLFFELGLAVHVTTNSEVARVFPPSPASENPRALVAFREISFPHLCLADAEWQDTPASGDLVAAASFPRSAVHQTNQRDQAA